jgi:mRNA interferase RelE/StbE
MTWTVIYHPDVADDLRSLGRVKASRIVAAMDERIRCGEPNKIGRPLRGNPAGCRRLRVGDTRIVYRVDARAVEVLVVAVGPWRDNEIYRKAGRRRSGT